MVFMHRIETKKTKDQNNFVRLTFWYDLDTVLPFPTSAQKYYKEAIDFKKDHQTLFRVMTAEQYLENFSSDRSHMIIKGKKKTGEPDKFVQPPPKHPLIRGSSLKFD